MFEGKPPVIPHALDGAEDSFADAELTAFSWDDLMARLSACQELRAALAPVAVSARASFAALTAEHHAKRSAFAQHSSKHAVNPVASANGKGSGAKEGEGAHRAVQALRGIA